MPQSYTTNGYPLDEVISTIQKAVRKQDERVAMYFALELIPKFESYLWRRLITIAHEDIGIANLQVVMFTMENEKQYLRARQDGKSGTARLILANTILSLSRSPKSRIADEFQCAVLQDKLHESKPMPIPDYGLDKHTRRGKSMGRGVQHWLEDGCELIPLADLPNPYKEPAESWWANPEFKKTEWAPLGKTGVKQLEQLNMDLMLEGGDAENE